MLPVRAPGIGPEEVTRAFYDQWINYEGDPMEDGLYASSAHITSDFARRLQEAAQENDTTDPVLCETTDPVIFDVLHASVDLPDRSAVVAVDEHYEDGTQSVIVSLVIVQDTWRVDNVLCP